MKLPLGLDVGPIGVAIWASVEKLKASSIENSNFLNKKLDIFNMSKILFDIEIT